MIKARAYLPGLAFMAVATAAHAGFSVTPTVVSDYDFRGISQTKEDPAAQVGVDYSTGPLHIGAWASNIDWGPGYKGSLETDALADLTFGSDDTVKINIGAIGYLYPRMTDQNTYEGSVTLSKKIFSASVRYSNDWFNLGKAWYYEANVNVPIGESGFNVTGHVGRSEGDAWKGIEYTDYGVGVTKSFGNFVGGVRFVASNAPETTSDVFSTDDRVIVSVSTTLPWASK